MMFLIVALLLFVLFSFNLAMIVQLYLIVLAFAAIVMTPTVWLNDTKIKPYSHTASEISVLSKYLVKERASLQQNIINNPAGIFRSLSTSLAELMKDYELMPCSVLVEQALGDWFNVNWANVKEEANTQRDLLIPDRKFQLPFPQGRLITQYTWGRPVVEKSKNTILFVPLSLASDHGITNIKSAGPIIIFSDRDHLPQGLRPLQARSDSTIFVCTQDLTGMKVRVLSPYLLVEDLIESSDVIDPSCNRECRQGVHVFSYRDAIHKLEQLLRGLN